MLAQLTPTASAAAATAVALITAAAALAKKFLARKPASRPEYITRAEFHQAIDATRDRIGASYLALADKIDLHHTQLLSALERQGANFERRLDQLESNLARLDERTSPSP